MKSFLLVPLIAFALPLQAAERFVASDGNDKWSGALASPNAARTDGPLRTIERARDVLRGTRGARRISVRGGTYYLKRPIVLTPADSRLQIAPFRGENVLLSGGRPITNWKKSSGNIWTAKVSDAPPNWYVRQLRAGNRRQILARTPNFNPRNPYKGGWNFVQYSGPRRGVFGAGLSAIHTPNDWFEWKVSVPKSGDYRIWAYYGALNKPFGNASMAGRTQLQVDGGAPVVLQGLEDTPDWGIKQWSDSSTIALPSGTHTLRWTNVQGGGLNLDAFVLADGADWKPPVNIDEKTTLSGSPKQNLIVVQAEAFTAKQSKEGVVDEVEPLASRTDFEFKAGDIQRVAHPTDAEIHIFPAWGWVSSILYVESIDFKARKVLLEDVNASEELRVGNRYYLSNVREALDAPGEWFYDARQKQFSWWPDSAASIKQKVVAPVLDRLFDLKGNTAAKRWVEGVSIKGFTFSDTIYSRVMGGGVYEPNDATIWLSGARRCVVEGNRFVDLGGYALRVQDRSAGNQFVGNEVGYVGQGGVLLRGQTADQPRDTLIAGNWMHHLGQVHKHVGGVYALTARGTRVSHNRFEDLPRYAVSFKGFSPQAYSRDNVCEYNDILRTNLETNDTGAIETLGRSKLPTNTIIQYNRILDVVGLKHTPEGGLLSPYFTWGIYLDDYSSGVTVRGNLVARHDWGGGCIHGGQNNSFENNIFINGLSHQMRYQVRDEFCKNNRFERNIIAFRNPQADLYSGSGTWRGDVLAASDFNLLWHTTAGSKYFEKPNLTPLGTWQNWRNAGWDRHSRIADPMFESMARDDYRLKTDSPALKLGFKALPFEKMGLRGYARSWKR